MKFHEGDLVKHKISKQKFVIVKCKAKEFIFRGYDYYLCGSGKLDENFGQSSTILTKIFESELELAK